MAISKGKKNLPEEKGYGRGKPEKF